MPDEPDLTPEQEREVRRLLADARHSEPMPTDVAARLDRVLAELGSRPEGTRLEPAPRASVTELASRRRHRAATLLVAAAAVVAVGIGVDRVIDHEPTGSASSTAAESGGSVRDSAPSSQGRLPRGSGAATNSATDSLQYRLAGIAPVRVRADHFAADVARARLAVDAAVVNDESQKSGSRAALPGCTVGTWGRGTYVPVRYDGHPAVLVFRKPGGDTQVADLFGCGGDQPLRSITLPAR